MPVPVPVLSTAGSQFRCMAGPQTDKYRALQAPNIKIYCASNSGTKDQSSGHQSRPVHPPKSHHRVHVIIYQQSEIATQTFTRRPIMRSIFHHLIIAAFDHRLQPCNKPQRPNVEKPPEALLDVALPPGRQAANHLNPISHEKPSQSSSGLISTSLEEEGN